MEREKAIARVAMEQKDRREREDDRERVEEREGEEEEVTSLSAPLTHSSALSSV